jgi:hypothetical protein
MKTEGPAGRQVLRFRFVSDAYPLHFCFDPASSILLHFCFDPASSILLHFCFNPIST